MPRLSQSVWLLSLDSYGGDHPIPAVVRRYCGYCSGQVLFSFSWSTLEVHVPLNIVPPLWLLYVDLFLFLSRSLLVLMENLDHIIR